MNDDYINYLWLRSDQANEEARSDQANEEARHGIERSIATICEEEGISFEPVLYILFFWCCISNKLSFSFFRVDNLF